MLRRFFERFLHSRGKTACGAADCPRYQQPFEQRAECEACGGVVAEGAVHTH